MYSIHSGVYHWFSFNVSPWVRTGPGARVTSVFISLMDPSSNFLAADTDTHQSQHPPCTLHWAEASSLGWRKIKSYHEKWDPDTLYSECIINCIRLRHDSKSDNHTITPSMSPCVTHLKSSLMMKRVVSFMSSFYGSVWTICQLLMRQCCNNLGN